MSREPDEAEMWEGYLRGDVPLDELPRAMAREERRLRDLMETARSDRPASPFLKQRIMAQVRAESEPFWRKVVVWFVRPRQIRLSPATALGGAMLAALLVLALPEAPFPDGGGAGAVPATVVTRFVFVAPQATSVHLTGDFLEWDQAGLPLADPRGNGVWTVDVPLEPGVYQYSFVVDGREWRPDPLAVSQVDDGFGRQNSVVIVARET